MTTTVVTIEFEELEDAIQDIEKSVYDMEYTDLFYGIIAELEDLHREYFYQEASPDGDNWPPLAPATIASKGHSNILYASGRLNESLAFTSADSIRRIEVVRGMSALIFGTSVPYSVHHQFGTKVLPIREHIGITAEKADELAASVIEYTVGRLQRD